MNHRRDTVTPAPRPGGLGAGSQALSHAQDAFIDLCMIHALVLASKTLTTQVTS